MSNKRGSIHKILLKMLETKDLYKGNLFPPDNEALARSYTDSIVKKLKEIGNVKPRARKV